MKLGGYLWLWVTFNKMPRIRAASPARRVGLKTSFPLLSLFQFWQISLNRKRRYKHPTCSWADFTKHLSLSFSVFCDRLSEAGGRSVRLMVLWGLWLPVAFMQQLFEPTQFGPFDNDKRKLGDVLLCYSVVYLPCLAQIPPQINAILHTIKPGTDWSG